ncbi:hypothetical protein DRW42_05660 [Pedobacter miscanthi]|uniref:Uncharacterized protein n=1 Tax=Pedobacter miscanthi TaxID=2259170 RepID=A0A366L8X7_9SPHI|nr:hypothetical protein DRW42_05660 [Pedobacter miscanthi]
MKIFSLLHHRIPIGANFVGLCFTKVAHNQNKLLSISAASYIIPNHPSSFSSVNSLACSKNINQIKTVSGNKP